ncbi:hypothetical protein ASG40_06020 [Methylobacterium sp. Leaf399]|nr:hypothetical protein ASF39_08100 [Methylobacterium sp. Leaf108]KQT14855.1 hypothetical protein ASG40_06020 [Methylobacterium sp. Leaf399]KQT90520.1 hypothetical protein ASG59_01640 [Methylobacterium sp. Leaf466]
MPVKAADAPAAAPLQPAVRLDIRPISNPASPVAENRPVEVEAERTERRVTVDQDTKTLVYQLVDPGSGDVVVQLPDPVVLKARAYAAVAAARSEVGERPLDRTA